MAHLDRSFTSFEAFLGRAEAYWTVDLLSLNNSGVDGSVIIAMTTEDDGERYLNFSVSAENLVADVVHPQHVHGTFNEDGTPSNARAPILTDDVDRDGTVEVLEGLAAYGDIILSLTDGDAPNPTSNGAGQLSYVQSFNIDMAENLVSPVSSAQYDADDLMPLDLREVVIHGVDVPDGTGAGTEGEVNGMQDGYVPILPAAAGQIEKSDLDSVMALLAEHKELASGTTRLTNGDDVFDGGIGDDTIIGRGGDDVLDGGADNDDVRGFSGNDVLSGGAGDDLLAAGSGDDFLAGGDGDDVLMGKNGADALRGNAGSDMLMGNGGSDVLFGGNKADVLDGGAGADLLAGNNGRDMLTGGRDADIFVFSDMREGKDTITDFEDGSDLIDLSGTGLGFDDVTVTDMGDDTMLSYGRTEITLTGVASADLSDSDFIFA